MHRRLLMAMVVLAVAVSGATHPMSASAAAAPSRLDQATTDGLVAFAYEFVARRSSALVSDTKIGSLQDILANNTARESFAAASAERSRLAELTTRRDLLREWGEAYSGSTSKVTLHKASAVGRTATLEIEELGSLSYQRLSGSEPPDMQFSALRQFTFDHIDKMWELRSVELLGGGVAPPNEPTGADPLAVRAALADASASQATAEAKVASIDGPTVQYSYPAMASYAELYWYHYNGNYRNFNNQGGDCTNFISQSLRAGGWADNSGFYQNSHYWWYNWLNQTWSWTHVQYWFEYAAIHSGRTYILGNVWSMGLADVLQVDFERNGSKDHTMIVSYRSDQPYLTYHTTNTYRRSLANFLASHPNGAYWAHRT